MGVKQELSNALWITWKDLMELRRSKSRMAMMILMPLIMMTLTMPMLFLSGIFFPIQMMPSFMQTIAYWLPFTYAIDAIRRIMIFGVALTSVGVDLLVMISFGVVMLLIAIPAFNRAMTK